MGASMAKGTEASCRCWIKWGLEQVDLRQLLLLLLMLVPLLLPHLLCCCGLVSFVLRKHLLDPVNQKYLLRGLFEAELEIREVFQFLLCENPL